MRFFTLVLCGQVASIVSRVFGDMIHVHGFVHCDPHPGNLLVRKLPDATTQLVRVLQGGQPMQRWLLTSHATQVVLDHGMYRRLDQDFRAAYCRLWKGMMLVDMQLVQQAARDMGVGEFAEVRKVVCPVWRGSRMLTGAICLGDVIM